jgi:predicted nucleotidyltransferase
MVAGGSMRGFLDRDFLKTVEGFLFCVVGGTHPRNRVISYLKYVPSREGRWGRRGERYSRTMPNYTIPSLEANIQMLTQQYPQYIFHSRILNVTMSAVPKRFVTEHYTPEKQLQYLFTAEVVDPLQETAIQLTSYLSQETSIPEDRFGVTGSILTNIHQPTFSDIDLVVYGCKEGWKLKRFLQRLFEVGDGVLTRYCGEAVAKILDKWLVKYPLTLKEAAEVFRRRWNYGFFKETPFSIHVVKTREEVWEIYGDKQYTPLTFVEGKAKITEVENSLVLPCTYGVDFFEGLGEGVTVEKIVSYDGFYGGIFDCGEIVDVRGKLEKVHDRRRRRVYHQIVVGSLEARGEDYIKPIL